VNLGHSSVVVQLAERHELIRDQNGQLSLAKQGRARANAAIVTT